MKKIKLGLPVSIFLALCTLGLTACSQQTSAAAQATSGETSQAASAESGSSSAKNEIFGKVTAVDGSKITLALGTMERGFGNGTGQRKQGASSWEGSGAASGSRRNPPSGSGNPGSQNSSGKNASRGTGGSITLSGETTTITVSDSSVIKKMERGSRQSSSGSSGQASGQTSGSLSDIKVGAILGIEKDSSGAVTSITILSGFGDRGSSASSSSN